MKSLTINTIACLALLLPITQAQAAGAGSTFGGFTPKQKFSLEVTEVISAKIVGTTATRGLPIPEGFPKFKVKQTVKFTIGAKGQLIGPSFSIPFNEKGSSVSINSYDFIPVGNKKTFIKGLVYKNTGAEKNGLPSGALVTFQKFSNSNATLTTKSVTYSFYSYKK